MKETELREMIKEELKKINEAKIPQNYSDVVTNAKNIANSLQKAIKNVKLLTEWSGVWVNSDNSKGDNIKKNHKSLLKIYDNLSGIPNRLKDWENRLNG